MFVRRALVADARAIKQVHVDAYHVSYRGYLPDDVLDAMSVNDEVVERTKNYLAVTESYVAISDGKIVGFAHVVDLDKRNFEIVALYVHPDYQKHGAGSSLIKEIIAIKQKDNFSLCELWTLKNGPSLGFYHKQGFALTNDEKCWHYNLPIVKLEKAI